MAPPRSREMLGPARTATRLPSLHRKSLRSDRLKRFYFPGPIRAAPTSLNAPLSSSSSLRPAAHPARFPSPDPLAIRPARGALSSGATAPTGAGSPFPRRRRQPGVIAGSARTRPPMFPHRLRGAEVFGLGPIPRAESSATTAELGRRARRRPPPWAGKRGPAPRSSWKPAARSRRSGLPCDRSCAAHPTPRIPRQAPHQRRSVHNLPAPASS